MSADQAAEGGDAAAPNAASKYLKGVVCNAEMPQAMIEDIVEASVKIVQDNNVGGKGERQMAEAIKKHCDAAYTPSWNVMVGSTYGSYVTHETKRYLQFRIGHMQFLVWKCG